MKQGVIGSASRRALCPAVWCAILFLAVFCPTLRGEEPQSITPGEVHSIPREKAALALPVTVRGVVTYSYPEHIGSFVIEDESGGLYIDATEPLENGTRPAAGNMVEVSGVTGEGGYAPVVKARAIRILGTAPLPVARPATVNQLLTGRFDSRRVEIRGVVQHAEVRGQIRR